MQNHLIFARPKKSQELNTSHYVMEQPFPMADSKTLIPLIDIADIGKYLQPFLDDPEKYNRASLTAATAFYTPREMCETWTKKTGKQVEFGGPLGESNENLSEDSLYYGAGSSKALEWTLAQMVDRPSSWESFVERHEPWFE